MDFSLVMSAAKKSTICSTIIFNQDTIYSIQKNFGDTTQIVIKLCQQTKLNAGISPN